MGLWVAESERADPEQFSSAENVTVVNWWPCQTAAATVAAAAASVA